MCCERALQLRRRGIVPRNVVEFVNFVNIVRIDKVVCSRVSFNRCAARPPSHHPGGQDLRPLLVGQPRVRNRVFLHKVVELWDELAQLSEGQEGAVLRPCRAGLCLGISWLTEQNHARLFEKNPVD